MFEDDRRHTPRLKLRVALTVVSDNATRNPFRAESDDISAGGVHFTARRSFKVGTAIQILLQMPVALSGKNAQVRRCHGRVAHVRSDDPYRTGVGVQILYYEVLTPRSVVKTSESRMTRAS
jgi:hypothetical protein